MTKILLICTSLCALGISACNNSNNTPIEMDDNIPIPIDSISTNDIDTITINTTDSETKKDLDKPSYTIDIELKLYKATSKK